MWTGSWGPRNGRQIRAGLFSLQWKTFGGFTWGSDTVFTLFQESCGLQGESQEVWRPGQQLSTRGDNGDGGKGRDC